MSAPNQPSAPSILRPTSFLSSSNTLGSGGSPVTLVSSGTNAKGLFISAATLSATKYGSAGSSTRVAPAGCAVLTNMFVVSGVAITVNWTVSSSDLFAQLKAGTNILMTYRPAAAVGQATPSVDAANNFDTANSSLYWDLAYVIL